MSQSPFVTTPFAIKVHIKKVSSSYRRVNEYILTSNSKWFNFIENIFLQVDASIDRKNLVGILGAEYSFLNTVSSKYKKSIWCLSNRKNMFGFPMV